MPSKLPQLKAILQKVESEYAVHPTKQLQDNIAGLRAKIDGKTKKKRDIQKQKQQEKKKKEKATLPSSVIAITATKVDAETRDIEPGASKVETERQGQSQIADDVVIEAWTKANEAKAAAEKAVQELKSLRTEGKATSETMTAARLEVQSRQTEATQLEIAAILAEDDLQKAAQRETLTEEAVTGEAATEDKAHESVEEGYASPLMGDGNDSLGPWASPIPQSNDLLVAPETFTLPTPAQTISSPTTGPASPVKEEATTSKGTKDEPIIVDEAERNLYAFEREHDQRLEAIYQRELSAKNPLATLIAEYIHFREVNGPTKIKGKKITKYTLMTLFDNVWLDDDILNTYVELLLQEDPRFQVVQSNKVQWELDALNREGGSSDPYPTFDMKPETRTFLIPTFVNDNHWMLCVARLPNADEQEGTLDWYNSLNTFELSELCEGYAAEVVRVLLWLATIPGSPLTGVSWKLNKCRSGHQTNGDDCSVFVAAIAAAIVLDAPIPQNAEGFRLQIALQVIKAARGDTLDWTSTADVLGLAARAQTSLIEDEGEDDAGDEGDADVGDLGLRIHGRD